MNVLKPFPSDMYVPTLMSWLPAKMTRCAPAKAKPCERSDKQDPVRSPRSAPAQTQTLATDILDSDRSKCCLQTLRCFHVEH